MQEEMREGFKKRGLSSFKDIFRKTWRIYKENFPVLLGVAAVPVFVSFLFSFLGEEMFRAPGSINTFTIVFLGVFSPALFVIMIWSQAALLWAVQKRDEVKGIKEAYKKSWKVAFAVWWAGVLSALIAGAGFLFLIVPGIYLSFCFAFSSLVAVDERKKGFKTLQRSKQLVDGHWWGIVGRFFLFGVVVAIISFLLSLAAGLLITLVSFSGILSEVISYIPGLLIAPLSVVWLVVLYEELKEIKKGVEVKKSAISKTLMIILVVLGLLMAASVPVIMGLSLRGARSKASSARVISSMSQLRAVAEVTRDYETGYDISCGKDEAEELCEDIREYAGEEPVIYAEGDSYCAYVELPGGDYYCIDSTGYAEETETSPASYCNPVDLRCSPDSPVMPSPF